MRTEMYRKNRNGARKERMVMLASCVLVLTALTVTGIFVKGNNRAQKQDYIVDLEAIEEGSGESADALMPGEDLDTLFAGVGTDDLDYDPAYQEAHSAKVENTEEQTKTAVKDTKDKPEKKTGEKTGEAAEEQKTEKKEKQSTKSEADEETQEGMFDEQKDTAAADIAEETAEAISTTVQPALDFQEEEGLVWPVVGDVLINYSMDKTVYFPTLEQYKYNPAIVISAPVGENIAAAADGRIVSVGYDPMLGNTIVMDLGNGYELTYGQLENITVSEGGYVTTGDMIATVASPTKYYSVEGSNIYLSLTKDGEPVNPMSSLQ